MPVINYQKQVPLTPGEYQFRVAAAQDVFSKSGTPGLELTLKLDNGATVKDTLYDTEKAHWRFCELIGACWVGTTEGASVNVNPATILNQTGRVVLANREYKKQDGTTAVAVNVKNYLQRVEEPQPASQPQQPEPQQTYTGPTPQAPPPPDEPFPQQ